MEQTYNNIGAGSAPVPGLLPFVAKSVIINSGKNYVSSKSLTFPTVPPNVSGFQINLAYPTNLPDWIVTEPPAALAPIGPASQILTSITYSDQELAFAPGIVTQQQQVIANFQTVPVVAGVAQATIQTGLCRALSFWAEAVSGVAIAFQIAAVSGALTRVLKSESSIFETMAFGQGTSGLIGYNGTGNIPVQMTGHLFPAYVIGANGAFWLDTRQYF